MDKLARYIEHRYWKERDSRGAKPEVSHRTIVMMLLVMGIKDWNLNQLHSKLRSRKHGGPLRRLVGLPADPEEAPNYTTLSRRINALGIYPLKFLMRILVREAVSRGYIDVSNVMLDTSLIAAYSDLARFFPDSSTGFSEEEADWSYPKKWTGRVFGFKLSLASAKDGEPIDADVVTANLSDTSLGKQNIRRLGRIFAPLDISVEFVLGDAGYCSNPLRDLVGEVLGAAPLFHFNPRNGAKKRKEYTYLDDPDEWLDATDRAQFCATQAAFWAEELAHSWPHASSPVSAVAVYGLHRLRCRCASGWSLRSQSVTQPSPLVVLDCKGTFMQKSR